MGLTDFKKEGVSTPQKITEEKELKSPPSYEGDILWKRLMDRYSTLFLYQYTCDGEYKGPDPKGEIDEIHELWEDRTDDFQNALLTDKYVEHECGHHCRTDRDGQWMRCPNCHTVLVDLEPEEIDRDEGGEEEEDKPTGGLASFMS